MNMKMGIYIPFYDSKPAGLGRYIDEICNRLISENNGKTYIITAAPQNLPISWKRKTKTISLSFPIKLFSNSIVAKIYRLVVLNFISTYLHIFNKIDILFCPTQEGAFSFTKKQILVIHDLTALIYPSPYFSSSLIFQLRHLLPLTLKDSCSIIAVSNNTKIDVNRQFEIPLSKIHVVGEGYNKEIYRSCSKEECEKVKEIYSLKKQYIMYSGTFAPHKNVAILPYVLKECAKKGYDIELVITGRTDAGDFKPIKEAILAAGVEDRIKLLGYLPIEHMTPLMSGAVAFVFPSLYEGFGLAPLEAMASGAVVISSNRASLPEVVGNGGLLLSPEKVDIWADAIINLLKKPELSHNLRTAALAQSKKHDWQNASNRISDIFRNCINE